jgi:hypothetical protein
MANVASQHLKAGMKENGEVAWMSGVVHSWDSASECANFARLAMSRIQSMACANFTGSHPVPSVALAT